MKIVLIPTLLLLMWAICPTVQAQSFQTGYMIDLEGDTIRGLIQDNGVIRNSYLCVFKKEAEADAQRFSANDILAYGYDDQVWRARSLELFTKNQDREVQDVFVRFLVRGKLSLLIFTDRGGKTRYYLEDKAHGVSELYESTRLVNGGRFRDKRYRGVLTFFTEDCGEDLGIEEVSMNEKSLIRTVLAYNDCVGVEAVQQKTVQKRGVSISLMPHTGLQVFSPLRFDTRNALDVLPEEQPDLIALQGKDILASVQPTAGLNILLSSGRVPNLFLMTGVHYNPIVWESRDGTERFSYDILEVPVMIQYHILPRRLTRIVPFVQLGFVAPFQLAHENTNEGIFNVIDVRIIQDGTTTIEREKVDEVPLVEDEVNFSQSLKFGGGLRWQREKSQWLLMVNWGVQAESELGDFLRGTSGSNLELRLGWIPNW